MKKPLVSRAFFYCHSQPPSKARPIFRRHPSCAEIIDLAYTRLQSPLTEMVGFKRSHNVGALFGCGGGRPAQGLALLLCLGQARLGTLYHQIPFEFGERCKLPSIILPGGGVRSKTTRF